MNLNMLQLEHENPQCEEGRSCVRFSIYRAETRRYGSAHFAEHIGVDVRAVRRQLQVAALQLVRQEGHVETATVMRHEHGRAAPVALPLYEVQQPGTHFAASTPNAPSHSLLEREND